MVTRQSFLKALEENEDDTTTRLVYADWLEEKGEDEEAGRQRAWPAAKTWLLRFCEANNNGTEGDDYYFIDLSYLRLMQVAREASQRGDYVIECGANEDMCIALRQHAEVFWRNWSIVTGIAEPSIENRARFGCSC